MYTADIGMRFVVRVPDHQTAGRLMDAIAETIDELLKHEELTGRFDFTHFNTRPCKAAQMSAAARRLDEQLYDPGSPIDEPMPEAPSF